MQYYNAAQLAEMFGKSKITMMRKISAGEFGDTLNDGRSHLVSETGLQAYIKKHTGPAHYERHYSSRTKHPKHEVPKKITLEDIMTA